MLDKSSINAIKSDLSSIEVVLVLAKVPSEKCQMRRSEDIFDPPLMRRVW
ncbi:MULTISPECIES: hypothetical protein [unclassified Paraburkholderia]|nr:MULTISPECIES: hypothetical protein [unclassified Paraburkholderia]